MGPVLPPSMLPAGFSYPATLRHAIEVGLVNMEPWYLLTDEDLLTRCSRVAALDTGRELVPFAATTTGDDVACLDAGTGTVVIVDDQERLRPGARLRELPDIDAWFREAMEDFIDFSRPT